MGALDRLTFAYSDAFETSSRAIFIHFMNISLKRRYVYCATPKVACSTILQTLQRAELEMDGFLHDPNWEIHDRTYSPFLSPLQVGDFKALVDSGDFFKFCFVRNPYDRLVSCYIEKVISGGLTPYFLERLNRAEGPVTFDDFIDVVTSQRTEEMEAHYAVQYLQTFQKYIDYDFIGRFEDLQPGLEVVAERIGIDLPRYQARIDPHRTGEKPFSRYLNPAVVQKITDRYALDFDHFGYSPAPPI